MKISVELICPSCHGTEFDVIENPQSHMDYIGATCTFCRHELTEREVNHLLESAIAKEIEKKLKG